MVKRKGKKGSGSHKIQLESAVDEDDLVKTSVNVLDPMDIQDADETEKLRAKIKRKGGRRMQKESTVRKSR